MSKLPNPVSKWSATIVLGAACSLIACGDDSSPGRSEPDLAAVSAEVAGCIGAFCGPYRFEICIENRGDVDVNAPFVVTLAGREAVTVPALAAAELACFTVTNSPFPFNPVMEVDPDAAIPDSDRSNNQLSYPQPNPTGCDVLCPGPTPTPARLP